MFEELLQGVEEYRDNLTRIVRESLEASSQDLLEEQKEQLLEGKSSNGEDLAPKYSEDLKPKGYFRSPQSAANYSAWKDKLTYPKQVVRNSGTPNLYIDGTFHNQIVVKFDGDSVVFSSSTPKGEEIMSKYGDDKFGLTSERWQRVLDEISTPKLIETFVETINRYL